MAACLTRIVRYMQTMGAAGMDACGESKWRVGIRELSPKAFQIRFRVLFDCKVAMYCVLEVVFQISFSLHISACHQAVHFGTG